MGQLVTVLLCQGAVRASLLSYAVEERRFAPFLSPEQAKMKQGMTELILEGESVANDAKSQDSDVFRKDCKAELKHTHAS
ncbi:hypothetical protein PLICRDRAFT_645170 [Plicaturopsis crispa FD-325 SS-3]|nr:hypothetical protein PLICRDRAFT_645170 [Plicaturopsis crispa FD-325 SS-3]